jgi:Lon protease-like protein
MHNKTIILCCCLVVTQAITALKEQRREEPCDVLPLYALDYVLPGQSMSLNMFEPRYRLMTRRCMDGDRKFGMLGVRPDPVHRPGESARIRRNLGTEVEIIESKQMFDGRCHIEVKALQRFEVISTKEIDGYRCANVRFYKDEPTDDGTDTSVPYQPGSLALQEVRKAPYYMAAVHCSCCCLHAASVIPQIRRAHRRCGRWRSCRLSGCAEGGR